MRETASWPLSAEKARLEVEQRGPTTPSIGRSSPSSQN